MGFVQLALAFAAVIGYALALNGSLPPRVRWHATLAALAAAIAFSTLAPSWAGGVALMLIGMLALGAFAACTLLVSMLFDLDGTRGPVSAAAGGVAVAAPPRLRPASVRPVVHPS